MDWGWKWAQVGLLVLCSPSNPFLLEVGKLSVNSYQLKHLGVIFSSKDLKVIRLLCLHLDLYPVYAKLRRCFQQWWSLWAQESLCFSVAGSVTSDEIEAKSGISGWPLQWDVLIALTLSSNLRISAFLCLFSNHLGVCSQERAFQTKSVAISLTTVKAACWGSPARVSMRCTSGLIPLPSLILTWDGLCNYFDHKVSPAFTCHSSSIPSCSKAHRQLCCLSQTCSEAGIAHEQYLQSLPSH